MMAWGAWRPDVGGPNSGFAMIADSVLPQSGAGGIGYGPFPQLLVPATAGPLSGPPRGSISLTLSDGSSQVYFATASTIEQLQADYTFSPMRPIELHRDTGFLDVGLVRVLSAISWFPCVENEKPAEGRVGTF